MKTINTKNEYGKGTVKSWASILDGNTIEQAKMLARHPAVDGHVALMPDAHVGIGAVVGSVIKTRNALIPAAVGVDIGCGMVATKLSVGNGMLSNGDLRDIKNIWEQDIPAGVGKGRDKTLKDWKEFEEAYGYPHGDNAMRVKALTQFGTLGSGNHFAELSYDDVDANIWLIAHTGSRGVGNLIARQYIEAAKEYCKANKIKLEHQDLAHLPDNTALFRNYVRDLKWAEAYAYWQRQAIMSRMTDSLRSFGFEFTSEAYINCHHNYSEQINEDTWITRKGAINAKKHKTGIIPGSMGTDTYIVEGLGNLDAYESAPHGAGRQLARGQAKRTLKVSDLIRSMSHKVWDAEYAESLVDESPLAYKPIEVVMADSSHLITKLYKLTQLINYKGA